MTIVLGDIHFGKKGFDLNQYQNQINFFHKQLFPFIKKHKIKHVICLGDLFDHRTRQDVFLLLKIKKEFFDFFEENKITFTTLIGNHDIYFKHSREVYTLQLFDHYKYLNIINEPTLIKIGNIQWELFPYLFKDEEFKPRVKNVMGHFEINGFNMVGNYKCSDGMEVSSLKGLDKVLSGHFHIKQGNGVIEYLGTPYALDWNDKNQERGFYTIDEDGNMEFYENIISSKYIDIRTEKNEQNELKYYILDKEYDINEINKMSEEGHNIRINSSEEINIDSNLNIIVNINEEEDDEDYNNDVELFVKNSLSENSFKEYKKLYTEIVSEN